MNAKLLRLLRIGATAFGWLLVIGILAGSFNQLHIYLGIKQGSLSITGGFPRLQIVNALGQFLSSLGNAFFAFLIATVIRMIEQGVPVGIKKATRLMSVCCLSFTAEALVRVWSVVLILSGTIAFRPFENWSWRLWLTYASVLIPVLVPFLYAASVFVLYTHFARMGMFGSEVA